MLACAGALPAAARAFLEAAHGAPPLEAIELRCRAVETTLQTGRKHAALRIAAPLERSLGLRPPPSGWRALAGGIAKRARVRVRGLGFRERTEATIPPLVLRRHDLRWTLASAMSVTDPVIGRSMQLDCLLEALELGEPGRVARARLLEIASRSIDGAHTWPQIEAALAELQPMIERVGTPYVRGMVHTVRAVAANTVSRWDLAADDAARAEAIFAELPDGAWAAALSRSFHANALAMTGQFRALHEFLQVQLREAQWRGDRVSAWLLRTQRANVYWLTRGEPAEARRQYQLDPEHDSAHGDDEDELLLAHIYRVSGTTASYLYERDAAAAWRRVAASWRRISSSLLSRVQVFLIDTHTIRARAALAALAVHSHAVEPARARAAIDDAIGALRRPGAPLADAWVAVLQGNLAQLDGDRAAAAVRLEAAAAGFATLGLGFAARAARAHAGALRGDRGARQAAEDELAAEGVVEPARLAGVITPLLAHT